ncbi:DUF2213 domain-containing protein [Citrobacter freundii]|uniref:DUF2213 domain-containing protein n=1 Tax=Citrobacter freundii TaxID=546 RepID=UPI0011EF0878|nr:DUF2213 domain-containing protein [Citrobacter freundii]KAA0554482.1 DUF2213 domain-containing protein [Citrobacter braakii]MDV1798532.1 DUF2213 domain-containing protein [Citrobacter freundii]MDV1850404.1 DUF2213 domain-containing protein [Citrobacter freundii]MEB0365867.1 DUF2213 domain-containing protein [Citrobacter freundii]MEB0385644.1 DUF2213 domain-containing protein [Citrobacter freundii]
MKRTRVNVLSVINSASNITLETIDGKEHYVVKDVCPLYDNCVLNGGLYPTEENDKGYLSLNEVPMPFGHPKVAGKHVSARNVQALNDFYIGAYSLNARKVNGRVLVDARVDKRFAEGSEHGKQVVERLDAMMNGQSVDPICISTGLNLNKIQANGKAPNGKNYGWIATNQQYDHIAILLNEPPAGTPEEGIGMFVNSQGEVMDVEQVNLNDASDCRRDGLMNKIKFFMTNDDGMSFDEIASSLREAIRTPNGDSWRYIVSVYPDSFIYEEEKKGTPGQSLFKQKYLISDRAVTLVGEPQEVVRKPTEYEIKTNGENDPMKELIINALKAAGKPTDGKSDDELMDAYNQMAAEKAAAKTETPEEKAAREKKEADDKAAKDKANNSQEAPAWFKPFADDLAAVKSGLAVNSDKEKADKRNAVKLAMNMSDEEVADLDGKALDRLYANSQKSTGLNGAFRQVNSSESVSEMPE